MVAYLYRMPAGIPGDVNRAQAATIEPQVITPDGETGHPTAYGVPLVIDATTGWVRTLVAGDDTAHVVYGLLARPYPTNSTQDGLGVGTPPLNGPVDVLRRGYMTVLLSGDTPAVNGGQVYVWTSAATGSHITGGFEATDPSTDGFAVVGSYFKGPADADGNTEIGFNI